MNRVCDPLLALFLYCFDLGLTKVHRTLELSNAFPHVVKYDANTTLTALT